MKANIENLKFENMTPIQEKSYEPIVSGKDLAGLAQTGTGKTAAFLIPLIQRILIQEVPEEGSLIKPFENWLKKNFILILVPTRELASQVHDNVLKLCEGTDLKSAVIFGGTGYEEQKQALSAGADFVVSTPGRLIDLYKEHHVDLKQVRGVVFDEADRMFDMGFKDDMKYILQRIPKDRQYLVYSATLDFEVTNVAYEFGANPVDINISKDEAKAENVQHEIFHVGQGDKPKYLLSLIKKYNPRQAIVFTNFKANVDRVAEFLNKNGLKAQGISSLLNQSQRTRIMKDFKGGEKIHILAATDVAARGLDVKDIDLVVNFDLPEEASTYVHRIGRTGRAEAKGLAYSLVSDYDVTALERIENLLDEKIVIGWLEDNELLEKFERFPERTRAKRFNDTEKNRQQRSNSSSGDRTKRYSKDKPKGERRYKTRAEGEAEAPRKMYTRKPNRKSFSKDNDKDETRVHRDRKSGRHKSSEKRTSSAASKPRPKKKVSANTRVRSSSNSKRSTQVQSPGLGQKVKGFIRGIFGN